MSVDTARLLIIASVVSALAGAVLLVVSARSEARAGAGTAGQRARPGRQRSGSRRRGLAGPLSVTSVMTGVIVGVQWVVLRPDEPEPTAAGLLVLGLPAFLAAATIMRLLAILCGILRHHRQLRARRRQAGVRR